jgi:5-methylcytosine-specific restriction enzyme subunit McrC
MKVDVVHTVDGRPRIVADAKYKLESASGRYPNADHYQMLAYCTALRVPIGWLVYASGSQGTRSRHVRETGVEIIEYPLNLDVAPNELLEQMAELATGAWQSASVAAR